MDMTASGKANAIPCFVCGLENPGGHRCERCDSTLVPLHQQVPSEPILIAPNSMVPVHGRRCASCSSVLSPGFSFCGSCGATASGRARLISIEPDGTEGTVWVLDDEVVLGSDAGPIPFGDDGWLCPRHCRLYFEGDRLHVEDLQSVNGVYLRILGESPVAPGDRIRIGRQLLRIEPMPSPQVLPQDEPRAWGSPNPGYRARLVQLLEGGDVGEIFPLRVGENLVGRESGDVTFPGDRSVSSRHASIRLGSEGVTVRDLGSANGTYLRITKAAPLGGGDLLLLGNRLLRVERPQL